MIAGCVRILCLAKDMPLRNESIASAVIVLSVSKRYLLGTLFPGRVRDSEKVLSLVRITRPVVVRSSRPARCSSCANGSRIRSLTVRRVVSVVAERTPVGLFTSMIRRVLDWIVSPATMTRSNFPKGTFPSVTRSPLRMTCPFRTYSSRAFCRALIVWR